MRKDLTSEELYLRYASRVAESLTRMYGLSREGAWERMSDAGFREYFLSDPEMFEFMSASKVAKLVIVAERLLDRDE